MEKKNETDEGRNGWFLFFSILQLLLGAVGVATFVVLTVGGEGMVKWLPALVVSVIFAAAGVKGIRDYRKKA